MRLNSTYKKVRKPDQGISELTVHAGGGTRTHTTLPPTDFESASSASSDTPARSAAALQEMNCCAAACIVYHRKAAKSNPELPILLFDS